MNKLQLRVDRDDAELIARALRYLGEHWNDAPKPERALQLAAWIDYRVAGFWGEPITNKTDKRRKHARETRLAVARGETGDAP